MSLVDLRQRRMRQELPRIEARMKVLIAHVRFLAASGESVDARILMNKVDDAKALAMQLRNQLLSVTTEMGSLRHSRVGSDRIELLTATSRLAGLFAELEEAIGVLDAAVSSGMSKQGRWGDAAAAGPVSSLVGLLSTLFEIWSLERVRQRLRASR